MTHTQYYAFMLLYPRIFKDFISCSATPLSLLNWIKVNVCSPSVQWFQNYFVSAPLKIHAPSHSGVKKRTPSWSWVSPGCVSVYSQHVWQSSSWWCNLSLLAARSEVWWHRGSEVDLDTSLLAYKRKLADQADRRALYCMCVSACSHSPTSY